MTIASIVKICKGIEYIEGTEIELTVEETIKWFKENNLGIEFYDFNSKLIYKFHPEKFHSHIRPSILRVIYHNEHIEEITEMRSFIQKCINIDDEAPKLSNQYNISLQNQVNHIYS